MMARARACEQRGRGLSFLSETCEASSNERARIMSTEQRVIVVTGASQGIGAGIVQAFRDRNCRVIATSRSIKPATEANVVTVQGDVAASDTAENVFKTALERFGRVDTL